MALTVITTPELVDLVKNQLKFKVLTDNYYSTAGVKCSIKLNFSGSCPLNTETFTLAYTDEDGVIRTSVYVFKTSPSGYLEIATKSALVDVDDYVNDVVVPKLFENFYLLRDFNITVPVQGAAAATILLEAKVAGVCLFSTATEACTDFTLSNKTDPVAAIAQENFKVMAELFVENVYLSETFDKVFTAEAVPDSTNHAYFYFERQIRSFLALDNPGYPGLTVYMCSNIIKRYCLFFYESYGDPPAAQAFIREPVAGSGFYQALLAGLKADAYPSNTFYNSYFNATANKFLTNMPANSMVSRLQPQFLYVCTKTDLVNIVIKLYYTDGTNSTPSISFAASASTAGRILIIPVGYTQLNLDAEKTAGKTVQKYEVWCTGASGVISEVRTFYVKPFYEANEKYFMFLNRLGAFDTACFNGSELRNISTERNKLVKTNSSDTSALITGNVVDDVKVSENVQQKATGWMSRSEVDYLEEFFDSGEIFELGTAQMKKIVILDKDVDLSSRDVGNSEMFGFSFKWQYGWQNPV
jgi:hypothetical protein